MVIVVPEPSSADVYLLALDALEISLLAGTHDEAVLEARAFLAGLDQATAVRVAACLAVECRRWAYRPRKDRTQVLESIARLRLEVAWSAS